MRSDLISRNVPSECDGSGSPPATLRAEFGKAARERRVRVLRRATIEKHLSPGPAALIGPEKLPAEAFESRTIESLLAP